MPHYLYRHFAADGTLLYVGISFSALQRTANHVRQSHWFASIANITIEQHPSKEAAEKAEQEAIRIQPLYNVVHKAERHRRLKSSSRPPRYL
jgi:hypothetical protein